MAGEGSVPNAASELVVYAVLGFVFATAGWFLRHPRDKTIVQLVHMTASIMRRLFAFAFRLRTLFVMVVIFGVWLGRQHQTVRERKAVLAEIQRVEAVNPVYAKLAPEKPLVVRDYAQVSATRRTMGDESCELLNIPQSLGPDWIVRAEQAFPEADLVIRDDITNRVRASRDSLYKPIAEQRPNQGGVFATGRVGTK